MENKINEFLEGIEKEIRKFAPSFAKSPVRKTKYEVYKYLMASGSTPDVTIDNNIDTRYKRVTAIYMYTDTVIGDNLNLEFANDLRINDEIIYPQSFDSFLLYPIMQNDQFTNLEQPIAINNSKLEGRVKSTISLGANTYLTIILRVEE